MLFSVLLLTIIPFIYPRQNLSTKASGAEKMPETNNSN